ncbi:MAG TPA: GGDEF domain-containing protein, partial [Polyangiaceae bacterium]|nr:GGDEF domain-containing protein [Polyangiaceae bacterium]
EFGIVMVEAGATEAHIVCNRLRQRIADHVFEHAPESDAEPVLAAAGPLRIPVTASIGVAEFMPGRDTWKSLLERADRALYGAKQAGRNRVMTARASQSPDG